MKWFLLSPLFAAGLLLVGCAVVFPTGRQLIEVGLVEKDTSEETLDQGRMLNFVECQDCHRLYRPAEFSPEDWDDIVDRMARESSLDEEETEAVRAYLVNASRWTP